VFRKLTVLLLLLLLIITSALPVFAAVEIPEPFCGDLDEEDCELLHASTAAMFDLESYTTWVRYSVYQHGLPELPLESEAAFEVAGQYAFDGAARDAIRTLAVISRREPLAAVEAIGASPDLLIDLYRGMTADLALTLDLSESWIRTLEDEADVEWPERTTVNLRLVEGVLYFGIGELKPLFPELDEMNDWLAIELLQTLEQLVEEGAFASIAADVAASSEGRSVWGLEPATLNLITTMRSAFGRPQVFWPYMEISRRRDTDLGGQAGAVFRTDFDTLGFILSREFRDVVAQVLQVAASADGASVEQAEIDQVASLFWFLAPSLFRDLKVSGTSTIGLDDLYQHSGRTVFDWDLTTLLQMIIGFTGEDLGPLADEIFILYTTEFENSGFNEAVTITAPDDAEVLPLDGMEMEGLREFN
jgi:hypothetical protein